MVAGAVNEIGLLDLALLVRKRWREHSERGEQREFRLVPKDRKMINCSFFYPFNHQCVGFGVVVLFTRKQAKSESLFAAGEKPRDRHIHLQNPNKGKLAQDFQISALGLGSISRSLGILLKREDRAWYYDSDSQSLDWYF